MGIKYNLIDNKIWRIFMRMFIPLEYFYKKEKEKVAWVIIVINLGC